MKSSGSNSSSNGNGGEGGGCSSKVERKTIEKQRRMQMKTLSLKLASLIPKQPHLLISSSSSSSSKDAVTQLDNLEEAASYIIKLRNKIEELKQRKESNLQQGTEDATAPDAARNNNMFKLPIIEVRYQNPNLEVVLITNSSYQKLTFHKVIRIIEEEGAEIVNASHSSLGDKLVYTVHSQVRNPRSGLEASRVSSRLKDWI